MKRIKILNLYAGIGGNRQLWGSNCEVTAIENNFEIAQIYSFFFPDDNVIVCDAHKYLLDHYDEFDFIWSSPPCPSHSRIRYCGTFVKNKNDKIHYRKPIYLDISLYQEIIFLKTYFKGFWCVENVIPYYTPLIEGKRIGRHIYWSNFEIPIIKVSSDKIINGKISDYEKISGFNLSKLHIKDTAKKVLLRNCVNSKVGLHILNSAFNNTIKIKSKMKIIEMKR